MQALCEITSHNLIGSICWFPIYLVQITMAGELDLTPASAVYGCDGEDVTSTRSFGKYWEVQIYGFHVEYDTDIVHYIGRIMAFGVFILLGVDVLTACCLGKENTER